MDIQKLRKDLIEIYESYLANPNDKNMKEKAKKISNNYLTLTPILDERIVHAINLLVDIYLDLDNPGKPSEEIVGKVLNDLKNEEI